jgi:hypothetical protein
MGIPSELSNKSIPLEHIGLSEVAWHKDDALLYIEYLEEEGQFILGGDVLSLDSGEYRHNNDNWYFERSDGNAKQSIEHTRNYINKYPAGNHAFVLVVD